MTALDNVARLPLPAEGDKEPAQTVPVLRFGINVDLGLGRILTAETYLPNDCRMADLNGMMDKMTRAGDRQRAHYRLEELHASIATEEKHLAAAHHDRDN